MFRALNRLVVVDKRLQALEDENMVLNVKVKLLGEIFYKYIKEEVEVANKNGKVKTKKPTRKRNNR